MVKFNISNAVTHYRDTWYKALVGLPTGASDWVMLTFHERFIDNLLRFIDDVFGGWDGTLRQFRSFINCFNDYGKTFGIMFDKEQFGDTVNFLDVSVSNFTGVLTTY